MDFNIVIGLVVCVVGLLVARKLFASGGAAQPVDESTTAEVAAPTPEPAPAPAPAPATVETVDEEVEVVALSMKNKKAELLAAAKEMGVDVSASMTKAAILEALSNSGDA